MLQRIQTIWLFLAAVAAFLSLKLPFYSGTNPEGIPGYELMGTENFYLLLLTVAIGVIALICIFLYTNRQLQFRLTLLAIILEAGLITLYILEVRKYMGGTYALTAILQAAVLIFLILAAKGIKHDDKIVRESNRLR